MTTTLNVSTIDVKARTATSLSDHLAAVEDKIFTKNKHHIELQNLQTEIDHRKAAFNLSHVYAVRIFWLVFSWLLVVLGIIIWQGIISPSARLSNPVLITLLSTTTINMIGLLIIVIKYVFNHRLKI